jgi:hypothetical protein
MGYQRAKFVTSGIIGDHTATAALAASHKLREPLQIGYGVREGLVVQLRLLTVQLFD